MKRFLQLARPGKEKLETGNWKLASFYFRFSIFLVLALLLAALPAQAAWTHIQGAHGRDTAGDGTATSMTITLGANPTQGNLVAVGLAMYGPSALPSSISIKDSNNNAYQLTPDSAVNGTQLTLVAYLLYAPSNATKTINVTWTNGAYTAGWADEFHNSDSAVYDKDAVKAGGTATTNTPYTINLPSITPAHSGELLYSVGNPSNNITAPAAGATLGGWTGAAGGIDSSYGSDAEYILSSSGSPAVDFTDNTSGDGYSTAVMAFYSGIYTASPTETHTASDSVTATCTGNCGGVSHYTASPSESHTASDSLAASVHNFGVVLIGGAGNGSNIENLSTNSVSYSPTAGHAIIASSYTCGPNNATCQTSIGTTISIGDNVNNPESCFYSSPGSPWSLVETSSGAQKLQEYIWMCDQIPAGVTSFTVTCSTASSCSYLSITVTEWTGLATSGNPFDVDGGDVSSVQNQTATLTLSSSTNHTNELLYTFEDNTGDESMTPVAPGRQALQFYAGNLNEYALEASTGTYSLQATWTGNDDWYGVVAAIRTAGSSGGNSYTATPSETHTASDGLGRLLAASRGDSETNTASDALGRVLAAFRSDSETTTASDTSLARALTASRSESETNTAGDSLGRVAGFSRGDSETNSATDGGIARQVAFSRGDSETNTAADTLARIATFLRAAAESDIANDLLSGSKNNHAYTATLLEALSFSDGLARLAAYLRAAAETNAASDALGRLVSFFRGDSETNAASDSLFRARTAFAVMAEMYTAVDALARLGNFSRNDVETLSSGVVITVSHSGQIIVLPRHAGTVPGRTKAGAEKGRTKTGTIPPH